MRNDFDNLAKACYRWQRTDDLLAVTFKLADLHLSMYVKRAVRELYGDDNTGIYTFEQRCVDLVVSRDARLRDKVISLVRLDQHDLKGQMEFDFS